MLDFQTADYPDCECETIWYAFPSYYENMLAGVSLFYLIDQYYFYFYIDWEDEYIEYPFYQFSEGCTFDRMIFTNLNFVTRVCPSDYPYFDKALVLCFDTDCPAGNYREQYYDLSC
jgi:hypothetical protein